MANRRECDRRTVGCLRAEHGQSLQLFGADIAGLVGALDVPFVRATSRPRPEAVLVLVRAEADCCRRYASTARRPSLSMIAGDNHQPRYSSSPMFECRRCR
jgi:hypothetical protein